MTVTVMTVGYGDVVPYTGLGRTIGVVAVSSCDPLCQPRDGHHHDGPP